MRKLGIAVSSFGASQLSYLIINNINLYLEKEYKTDIIGFYENLIKYSLDPKFSCMQSVEMWGYDGPVIATNLNSAQDIIRIPTIRNKFFYIWDLEWINLIDKDYSKLEEIYSNPKLILIARCKNHAKLIESMWNTKVKYIIEDFNIDKLLEITK